MGRFPGLELKYITGHNPDLVIVHGEGDAEVVLDADRIDLTKIDDVEALLLEKGFEQLPLPPGFGGAPNPEAADPAPTPRHGDDAEPAPTPRHADPAPTPRHDEL